MAEPSAETLKTALQALYRVHAVEGPPGENGLRTVWHLGPEGAELLSLVDLDGRVRRQELTLLEDHYVWASGRGVSTGRLEHTEKKGPTASVLPDPELVPTRLMRGAQALGTYTGQDRYLLHMQRVLALAREGLEMNMQQQRPSEPTLPAMAPPEVVQLAPGQPVPDEVPPPVVRKSEGLVMIAVLGVGLVVGIALFVALLG